MLALFIIFYRIVTCRIFIDAFCCCLSVSFSIMFHDRNVEFYEFLAVYSKWIIDWVEFESCNRKINHNNIILNSRPNHSHVTLLSIMAVPYKWREGERATEMTRVFRLLWRVSSLWSYMDGFGFLIACSNLESIQYFKAKNLQFHFINRSHFRIQFRPIIFFSRLMCTLDRFIFSFFSLSSDEILASSFENHFLLVHTQTLHSLCLFAETLCVHVVYAIPWFHPN